MSKGVAEEVIRKEVRHAMLHQLGFDVYHPADSGFTYDPRPDLVCYAAPLVVECKKFSPSIRDIPTFNVGEIRWNQRRWLDTWVYYRDRSAFLAVGTTIKNPAFPKRTTWVIPWREWVQFEHECGSLGATPFTVQATMVDEQFHRYAMNYTTADGFFFPDDHPICSVPGGGLPSWMDFGDYRSYMWNDATTPKRKE